MHKFSNRIKLCKFYGHNIPKSSSKVAQGNKVGVFFFWRGVWNFTVFDGIYIKIGDLPDSLHKGIFKLK